MPSSTPFVNPETGVLDRDQIRREAEPLAKLVGLFVVIALAPLLVALVVGPGTLGLLFRLVARFVLAVGTGVTLMYVIARAIALSNDESAHARAYPDTGSDNASRYDTPRTNPMDEPSATPESGDEPDDGADSPEEHADKTEDADDADDGDDTAASDADDTAASDSDDPEDANEDDR
jgi:hypothetical protein